MNKKLFALISILAVFLVGGIVWANSASAHTATFSASCDGIKLHAQSYDGAQSNNWSVTINGETRQGSFGASFDQTFPVPQGGKTTTWSAVIQQPNGDYKFTDSGQVGPCGTPPPHDECPSVPGNQPPGTDCTPTPPPAPHAVKGKVVKIDKCGKTGDQFRLSHAYGAHYVVNGRVRQEGVWLSARWTKAVNISLRPDSKKYKVVGQAYWRLTFTNRACPTAPVPAPPTGA